MNELSEKHERFITEYIKSLNASQAAIAAGYSEKTAGSQGSRLLKDARIAERIRKRLEEIKSDNIASAQEVLEYFTRVMRREEKEQVVVTIKTEKADWILGDDGRYRKEIEKTEKVEVVEIDTKLSDANTAAIQLAKRYGLVNGDVDKSDEGALKEIIAAVKGVAND